MQKNIEALNTAIKRLVKILFSSRLIKQTHKILLQGLRGLHKIPGEFRSSQNWIGGASISNAVIIPPNKSEINELMGDLENFALNEKILCQLAFGLSWHGFVTRTPNKGYPNQISPTFS